jgi:hypothetical protein
MRRAAAVLLAVVPLWACSLGGGDPVGGDPDAPPPPCLCDAPLEPTLTTNCPWLDDVDADADPADTSCFISDWEHDFACALVAPEQIWLCCGSSPTAGVLCQYGECPVELGAPCCDGLQGNPHGYECVAGRWQVPPP